MFGTFSAITVHGLLYIQAHRFITIIRYNIIFRTRGKTIGNNIGDIVFNNNEIGIENDISKMFKLERVYLDNPIIEYRT